MVREDTSLTFEEYFWRNVDLDEKVVLDAGTGFGLTTAEIAKRICQQEHKGRIISVDIDPESFEDARKQLKAEGLLNLVTFVKADLSSMPEIASESLDVVVSTRTVSDINSFSCRLTKALAEFYRVLTPSGQVILSDECPILAARSQEETVAVARWQLAKAISHLIGRPHSNEVEPEDLEFAMKLTGFQECKWAVFEGDRISRQRINHFVERATEMAKQIDNLKLRKAFSEEIENVREMFNKQGGFFPPRYIFHAKK